MTKPFVGYHCGSEQFSPAELVELAVQAEHAGFQGVTVSDHFHPWQHNQGHSGHAWMTLAAIGARTERLLLGTGVSCPTYRLHPAQVAHAFATLGVLYPGRIFLGVGTGEAVNEAPFAQWGPFKERAARLVEAVTLIRELWSGARVDFDGQFYPVRGASLYDIPLASIPIYIAGSGIKSAGIAGSCGDGWITDHGTIRRGEAQKRSFAAAAEAAGKDAGTMPRFVELWAFVGDRGDAIAAAGKWLFLLVPELIDVADPRDVQRLAEERASPERLADTWVVSRDPEAHVAAVRELAAAGATHVFLHSPQENQRTAIDFYGRYVLPKLV